MIPPLKAAIFAVACLCLSFVWPESMSRVQGKGYYSIVNLPDELVITRVDAFVDGLTAFFEIDYRSALNYDVEFFDPPERKALSISVAKGIRAGSGVLAFSMPADKAPPARGFTVMLDPPSSYCFVYFALTDGFSGLARKVASDAVKASAGSSVGSP
jgi:hypothetical protein